MKISLLFIYLLHGFYCMDSDTKLMKYIDEQAKIVGDKLIRHAREEEKFYTAKFNYINNARLIGDYSKGNIFTFFNTTYMINDYELYQIQPNYTKVYLFPINEKLIFFKTTEFKSIGFFLFATNSNVLHIFGLQKKFFKIQNILHLNVTDADFFVNQNQLYLIVSNQRSYDLASIIIYKFTESHFDETEKFMISGFTNKLHTFRSVNSQIIVVLQKSGLSSTLYEFKNDEVKKLHKLKIANSREILSYTYEDKQYLIVCVSQNVTIYFWTGSDLLLWETFAAEFDLSGKKSIIYFEKNPYLVVAHNSNFLVFSLGDKLSLISNLEFNRNWTNIRTFSIINQTLIALGNTSQNETEINSALLLITKKNFSEKIIEEDKINNCFLSLEKAVYALRQKITINENSTQVLRQANENFEITSPIQKWENLQNKYFNVKAIARSHESKILIINKTAIVDLPAGAKKVTAKNIRFNSLNNQKWEPKNWLSYNMSQKITGPVKIKTLKTNHFQTNSSIFENLLVTNSDQTLSGLVNLKNLETSRLEAKLINNISVTSFYYKSQPVNIEGVKTFPEMKAKEVTANNINRFKEQILEYKIPNFDSTMRINNLFVENINEVNFENFKNSVFRIGIDSSIDGNLVFKNLHSKEMFFKSLNNKTDVLTISTNQTIKSQINISKMFTNNVKTNTVNGIDFKTSVATFENNTITGPVSIKHLNIKNTLDVQGNVSKEFLVLNDTHIVGTNESDFLQRYNKNVTIKGNLILKNFNIGKFAKLFVSGEEFETKIEDFWTKSTQQTIPVHFEAENGMFAPHLFTKFINNKNIDDYLLNSTKQEKPAKYYFDCVVVKGSVFLNPEQQHIPNLEKIQKESVKTEGQFNIKGRKSYENILKIDNLEFNRLESGNNLEIISQASASNISPQKISNLIVKGNLASKNITVENINNINLENLLANAIFVDQPQHISKLQFENITAQNVSISSTLNDYKISDLESKLAKIDNMKKIESIYVTGDVTFKNVDKLQTINNQNVAQLLQNSLSQIRGNVIYGNISFMGTVKVRDLMVTTVNNVNLQNLTQRILYKSWDQNITEPFTFTKLTTKNLVTDQINNINVKKVVDVTKTEPQEIFANILTLKSPTKIQNLTGEFNCNIQESLKNIHNPPTQFWNSVVIKGNATFLEKDFLLSRIFEKSVIRDKDQQIITGQVHFANHISANSITTEKNINDINLSEIINDAFLNRPDEEQVVSGVKVFGDIQAQNVVVLQHANVTLINEIDIKSIDSKIIQKSAIPKKPIAGQKVFFGGLQAKKLQTEVISGVKVESLVSFENPRKIPSAIFETISVVNNFNITLINGMPLDVLLTERVLVKSQPQKLSGNYFFKNVKFTGNIETPQINDIEINNVIFDSGTQVIDSTKKFMKDLKVYGNISTENINGLKISEAYEQSVLKNEPTNFTGVVQIMKPSFMEGNIQTEYINNIPIEYMLEASDKYSLQVEAHKIHKITKTLANFIYKNLNHTIMLPSELLYLEKSTDLQISLPNTINAHIVETRNDILIHIESEEDASFCGLPPTCKCPMQQTMQISSEFSVNVFMNKEKQRIYSYYNDDIIVNFITHSISSSYLCRTNQTKVLNEISSLVWNIPPQGNNSGGFHVHRAFFNGYIQGVKFFTLDGTTYIVVGISYDPVVNTHNVNTLILKFNEDKTALEEIQKIPTFGLKTISLFPTAQGVILIMGTDHANHSNTQIFRFSYNKQKFELLREVPMFGSLFADGIVLETDSLIILANKRSNLLILKYHPGFDNFYLYQTFQLDYPISSMSVFYTEGFGISDAYLSVVTTNSKYFIYSFWFIEGWKLEFSGQLDGIKILVPFKLNKKSYLFAPSNTVSSLLTLVEHD